MFQIKVDIDGGVDWYCRVLVSTRCPCLYQLVDCAAALERVDEAKDKKGGDTHTVRQLISFLPMEVSAPEESWLLCLRPTSIPPAAVEMKIQVQNPNSIEIWGMVYCSLLFL